MKKTVFCFLLAFLCLFFCACDQHQPSDVGTATPTPLRPGERTLTYRELAVVLPSGWGYTLDEEYGTLEVGLLAEDGKHAAAIAQFIRSEGTSPLFRYTYFEFSPSADDDAATLLTRLQNALSTAVENGYAEMNIRSAEVVTVNGCAIAQVKLNVSNEGEQGEAILQCWPVGDGVFFSNLYSAVVPTTFEQLQAIAQSVRRAKAGSANGVYPTFAPGENPLEDMMGDSSVTVTVSPQKG